MRANEIARIADARACAGPNMITMISDLDDFKALDPFFRIIVEGLDGIADGEHFFVFRIIVEGLDGIADGEHFFDLLADDVTFDYIITVPGYARRVEGRNAVAGTARTAP